MHHTEAKLPGFWIWASKTYALITYLIRKMIWNIIIYDHSADVSYKYSVICLYPSLIQLNAVESCLAMSIAKIVVAHLGFFFLNGHSALCPAFLKNGHRTLTFCIFQKPQAFWLKHYGRPEKTLSAVYCKLTFVAENLIGPLSCDCKNACVFIQGNKHGGCVDTTIFDNKLIFYGYF